MGKWDGRVGKVAEGGKRCENAMPCTGLTYMDFNLAW